MRFSRDWIAQYVDVPDDREELCRRLTDAGFNVELWEETGDDLILDLEITTNRSDAMNHLGLAREVGVMFDKPLRPPEVALEDAEHPLEGVPVAIDDFADCPRFAARVVRGVKVGPSPEWLVKRLESIGQRPINNIVDVTNFVLWETGQPLHAFDLTKLVGGGIRVRRAADGELLETLDGEKRELDAEMVVVADEKRAVALAGVMGGLDTEVTESTVDVLVEGAHWEPHRVRRTARGLGLTTDASYRFERGADPEDCLFSVSRAVELMAEVAGGEIQRGAADVREASAEWRLFGSIERRRLERFAGVEIPSSEIERILRELGYEPEQVEPDSWKVRVPSWRYYDCEALRYEDPPTVWEADIYEEVMRHFGFEKIPSTLPAIGDPDEGSSVTHELRERLRDHLSAAGLVEAINYGFYDADSDARFPTLLAGGDVVRVTNPLSENYSLMRRSLLPGLVESGLFNLRRGLEATRLYEIGHLFSDDGTEIETVALLCGGHRGVPWDRGADLDFFTLKGIVDQTAAVFGVELDYRAAELPGIVTGTGAEIFGRVSGERVGIIGQADEEKASVDLFVAELVTGPLEGLERDVHVVAPSKFPAIQADATITHAVDVPWDRLAAAIGESSVEDLIGYGLKDRYEGEGVPRGAVNTTIFFRYNADDRSLTQEEVNDRHMALVEKLETEFGWKP